jgi:Leu/Phe-tRNA-protein transferase
MKASTRARAFSVGIWNGGTLTGTLTGAVAGRNVFGNEPDNIAT